MYFNEAVDYPDIYGAHTLEYSCSPELTSGNGNIIGNPMFADPAIDDYHLTENSPCVDAGNPISPFDPDNTIADIGYYYYDQRQLNVTLTPENPPITIPATGGSFIFNISVSNNENSPQTIDIWTMVTLPNGSEYGPLIYFNDFTAPAGFAGSRDRIQEVPASAPAGNYSYDAYIGTFPDLIVDEDHFDFEKLITDDGSNPVIGWKNWGDRFGESTGEDQTTVPATSSFISAFPNPFNPVTSISFNLPKPDYVQLIVFDINGRATALLTEGFLPAGINKITFDASELASGIYFVRLINGKNTQSQKLLLIK